MFFSIIIPLYNNEKYIEECLESIISQSEKSFEIIIVNDGSTDDSKKVAEKFKSEYCNIQLINQENMGLFHTRCVGIDYSNGDYILFVDSDDKLKPDALKILKKNLNKEDLDMLIYNYARFNDRDKEKINKGVLLNNSIFENGSKKEIYEKVLISSKLNSMSLKVIKKNCFDTDEIRSYPDIKNGEDLIHTLPVITNAKKIKYIDDILYLYRKNDESMTRIFNDSNYFGITVRLKIMKKYLYKWKMNDMKYNSFLEQRYLKDIAGLVAYQKSNIKKAKKQYFEMLGHIKNDPLFKQIYNNSSNSLSIVYKIPNWLIFNNHFKLLYYLKSVVFAIRR